MTRTNQIVVVLAVVAVCVRLIWIDQPFVDKWSWRQSDVAAIAQNFYANGFQFAHPQIDWAGDQAGYVGTEFPVLPFAAALCYKAFGVHEWIGRVQSVILFALSLPCFFLLIRELSNSAVAVWATFFYAFTPLNLFAGREFMPDVPSLSLAIVGLWFFHRWLAGGALKFFILGALSISLSLLIKLPSILIGVPLAYLVVERFGLVGFRRWNLWLYAAIALLPSGLWYWHANQIAVQFYPHHFFGAGGIQIMTASWYWKIAKETVIGVTPLLLVIGTAGLFVKTRLRLFRWWLVATLVFIFVVGYGNRHPWYQLPLVPILAAFAGAFCAFIGDRISQTAVRTTLAFLLIGSFAALTVIGLQPLYHPVFAPLRDLGLELNRVVPRDSLIIAADNGNPVIFYYAQRKGWHFPEQDAIFVGDPHDNEQAIANLNELRGLGATYFVLTAYSLWWLDYYHEFAQHLTDTATVISSTTEYRIYKLTPAPK